jgi:hypothetical protein
MMKFAALVALLAGSASAFAPSTSSARAVTSLNAERSQSLPFMNRPELVSVIYSSFHFDSFFSKAHFLRKDIVCVLFLEDLE